MTIVENLPLVLGKIIILVTENLYKISKQFSFLIKLLNKTSILQFSKFKNWNWKIYVQNMTLWNLLWNFPDDETFSSIKDITPEAMFKNSKLDALTPTKLWKNSMLITINKGSPIAKSDPVLGGEWAISRRLIILD